MTVILEQHPQYWECPNCTEQEITYGQPNRYHDCRGLAGIYSPMVPAGTRCRVYAKGRDDYIGTSLVRRDGEGQPVSAVVTERWDGSNDTVTFPATVVMKIEV